jgi:hypothetical protein
MRKLPKRPICEKSSEKSATEALPPAKPYEPSPVALLVASPIFSFNGTRFQSVPFPSGANPARLQLMVNKSTDPLSQLSALMEEWQKASDLLPR